MLRRGTFVAFAVGLVVLSTTSIAQAQVKPSGDPIVIASITSDTGAIANRQAGDGLTAWAEQTNRAGGIFGRPVKINRCDDQSDVQKFGECARKIAADDSVLAVAGSQSRYVGITGGPIFKQAGLAFVSGNPANADEFNAPNTFCITGGFSTGFNAEFAYFKKQGWSKVTFITADSAGGHSSIALLQAIADPLGVNIDPIYISTTSPDYLPAATAAVASNSKVVVAAMAPAQTLQMLQALEQAGNKKPIAAGESTISAAVIRDSAANGLYVGQAFPSPDTTSPEMKLYKQGMTRIGRADLVGTASLAGWLSGRTLQNVILANGPKNLNRAAILKYFKSSTIKGVALLPDMSLKRAPKKTAGLKNVMNPESSVFQVRKGVMYAVPNSAAALP